MSESLLLSHAGVSVLQMFYIKSLRRCLGQVASIHGEIFQLPLGHLKLGLRNNVIIISKGIPY